MLKQGTGQWDHEKGYMQTILVCARASKLSLCQVDEIWNEIRAFHPLLRFQCIPIVTQGDLDLRTSLRLFDKTDFFTREIDRMLLEKKCRVAIHAAKDLPEPLPEGLTLVALTHGIDPSDVLVLQKGKTLEELPILSRIGSSSFRRDAMVKKILPNALCIDIRGSIEQRLSFLDANEYDGIVVANAALIRLRVEERVRFLLEGDTPLMQGKLAVLARDDDDEMRILFSCIDSRGDK